MLNLTFFIYQEIHQIYLHSKSLFHNKKEKTL